MNGGQQERHSRPHSKHSLNFKEKWNTIERVKSEKGERGEGDKR